MLLFIPGPERVAAIVSQPSPRPILLKPMVPDLAQTCLFGGDRSAKSENGTFEDLSKRWLLHYLTANCFHSFATAELLR